MISGAEPYVIADFSGGLDTKSNPLNIPSTKLPYVLNCHTNIRGSVVSRSGYTQLNSSGETGSANGLYDYPIDSGTRMLVQLRGGSFYKMDDLDGTWDSVTLAAGLTDARLEFETFDLGTGANRLIISSHSGVDQMQYWDGSGSFTQITDAEAGTPRYIRVWQQRVFAVGISTNPNNLRWSNSGSVTAWTAADNADIITNDGDVVTGLGILKKNLFVFKRYSIHRVTYTGGDPIIEISPMIQGTGCIASRTIKNLNIPDIGECLVFLTADGRIVAFTGHSEGLYNLSDPISVNNGIGPISMQQLNGGELGGAHAVVLPNKYWYMCFVPSSGSVLPDYCLVFDYLNKSWWPWDAMNFGSSAQVIVNNQIRIYGQGNSGTLRTHRLDDGSNSDNGTAINRVVHTPRIHGQSTSVLSSSYGAQFVFDQIGDYDVDISHRLDLNSTWSTAVTANLRASTSVLGDNLPLTLGGDEAVGIHVDVPKLKNFIQFRVETSNTEPAWTLYRIEEISKPRGIKP